MKGIFVTLYGINGIGKTTQAKMLVDYLRSKGKVVHHVKYPVYDLEPEGPFIYKYLRDERFRAEHLITAKELQQMYADNRTRYEAALKQKLDAGEWIIAEDYTGTGIAWGLTFGLNLEYLEEINAKAYVPDIAILLHGNRFETAIEQKHKNETDVERINLCKNFHLLLACKYDWKVVNANQSKEAVFADTVAIIEKML